MVLQKSSRLCHYHFIFQTMYTYISVYRESWSLIDVSGQTIPSVSDGYNYTCHGLGHESGRMLKSDLGIPFKALQVTVLVNGGEIVFLPNNHESQCKKHTSLLMTHDSSMAKLLHQTCKPFCEIPGPCRFEEMIVLSADERDHIFTCYCPQNSCNELFLWLQPEAGQGMVSICEIKWVYLQIHPLSIK